MNEDLKNKISSNSQIKKVSKRHPPESSFRGVWDGI